MNKFASGEYSGNLIFRKEILFLSCGAYVEVWKLRRCPQGQKGIFRLRRIAAAILAPES